ncbi:MAG TPA: hypothetical protein VG013_32470, partial [Gemmataceae bacterium]|nr:hypothetical protein [Gemmataceae bacterium]
MPTSGGKRLLAGAPWFRGEGQYPVAAYSEFMPPPRLGLKPYGDRDPVLLADDDPWGWNVSEYEEAVQLRPGLHKMAVQLLERVAHLCHGRPAHGIARHKLIGNPCWPPELAERAGALAHEQYVNLLPLALSRTQDDKGRVRWTLFGGSEQGPARAFWKSFFTAPRREVSAEQALGFIRRLLAAAYGQSVDELADLRQAGFRILPDDGEPLLALWREDPLPAWAAPYVWAKRQRLNAVKYLLTFQPFARLPAVVRRAYLAGDLHLLPFPGSLVFWGVADYVKLHRQLPLALQIPFLHLFERQEDPHGIRVPQSGWLHEARPGEGPPEEYHVPVRNTYQRTHRWSRVHRDEDELTVLANEDKLAHVLFSTAGDDLGLYGKPMARNAQIWTDDFELLLDGPRATSEEIRRAAETLRQGGLFGYRFQFPAMRVGLHEVYWHRPLVCYLSPKTGEPELLEDAPLGYMTAYRADRPDLARPIELWPRLLRREHDLAAVQLFDRMHDPHCRLSGLNSRKILETWRLMGEQPLPRSFARQLMTLPKQRTLDEWLDSLPERANEPQRAQGHVEALRSCLKSPAPRRKGNVAKGLTFGRTARRSFEVAYWKTIADLAQGRFVNKDNADCVRDPATQAMLTHYNRDLEALGDYLLDYYTRTIDAHGMTGKALAGDLPFTWRTDFNFPLFGGWLNNQEGQTHERDLLVV